ncbi:hypothetical protein QX249_11765 [Vibrio parahaemolyticus]|uniref:Uncharacterized protein n=1 Tax=Vibrio parahaemolyticus TaxID=670 RepID=A0AAW8PYN0_VIBPH|nr:hypothetical protein [Vibrio parahaemolyticus]EGR2227294.1 hypothetical protein [Vibrio parahaemolyticus]MDS1821343.1 hypothetical protein [Vibrio parahaemolyticus]
MFASINDATQFALLSELSKEDGVRYHRFIPTDSKNLPSLIELVDEFNTMSSKDDPLLFEIAKHPSGDPITYSKSVADCYVPNLKGIYAELMPSYIREYAFAEVGDLNTECPDGVDKIGFYQSQLQGLSWAIHCY